MSIRIEPDNAPVVSDAALEHWGRVYQRNPWIRARGILFETFLRYPRDIIALGLDSPLPAQHAVRRRLDADQLSAVHRSERLMRHTEEMCAQRRCHVSDGRLVVTMHQARLQVGHPGVHNPWTLEASR